MAASQTLLRMVVGAVVLLVVSIFQYIKARKSQINVPAIGASGIIASYQTASRFVTDAQSMLQEGYSKYPSRGFKIPHMNGWFVILSGRALVDELREAPDDAFGLDDATDDTLHITDTVGPNIFSNTYHVPIVRSQLTRNLGNLCEDVRDEVAQAFHDIVQATHDEWVAVPAFAKVLQIVSRASNRVFVGTPICRDKNWTHLSIHFTEDVVRAGNFLSRFPAFLHPIISRWQGIGPAAVKNAAKHLRPVIDERQRMYDQHGKNWPDKPNDMLSWLMDEATGQERSVEALCLRILFINFAAIHTSGMAFTHALFNLVSYPGYIEPLRSEVEEIVARDGWGKSALGKMHKVDSFLKESARLYAPELLSLKRKTLKDYTLSDGTFIPKGTHVSVASQAIHLDPDLYENAETFDGFRFSRRREAGKGGQALQHQMITTTAEYLTFGHGRHACPGRFFAAAELKIIMAEMLLNYDVKLESGGGRPQNMVFGISVAPNPTARVMFRKRQL